MAENTAGATNQPVPGFLRRNTWNLVSIMIGVGGIVLAIYFYGGSQTLRQPVFLVDPNTTEILSQERASDAPIVISRRDETAITDNVYAQKFYFWNAGRRPIRPSDILAPIQITLSDGLLLDYRLVGSSRAVVGATLRLDSATGAVIPGFRILEESDGLTGLIFYEASRPVTLKIVGVIEGVPEIRSAPDVSLFSVFLEMARIASKWTFLVAVAIAIIGGIFWVLGNIGSERIKRFEPVFYLLSGLVIAVIFALNLYRSAERDLTNTLQGVPVPVTTPLFSTGGGSK